jgi:hypothetical protein
MLSAGRPAHHGRRARRGAFVPPSARDQKPLTAFVVSAVSAACWRLAAAVITPRPVLAMRFAALSHILMKGFFNPRDMSVGSFGLRPSAIWPVTTRLQSDACVCGGEFCVAADCLVTRVTQYAIERD